MPVKNARLYVSIVGTVTRTLILVQFAVGTDATSRFKTRHNYVIYLSHTSPTLNTTLSFIHASYQLHKLQDRSAIVSPAVAGRTALSKLHTTSCLQILGTTDRKLVTTATRRLVFVHPCCNVMFVSRCALSDGLRTVQGCSAIMWVCHVTSQNSHLLGSTHFIVITIL
jgi:hypothetical protein